MFYSKVRPDSRAALTIDTGSRCSTIFLVTCRGRERKKSLHPGGQNECRSWAGRCWDSRWS